ncbi:DEAD/DEAH box helicase family protein [Streptomyces sp. NBC_00989]|uniref:DEAD/DEAH box helicase family protein n=1 Tax=Streptomyces sp. NBC_00989 TaxID=2903705 RepID=UPI003867DFAE|nr:DEAD/DEAH box helicase family protein [Streptomyces sp. NBC_00989]
MPAPALWLHQQELVTAAARTLATEPRTTGVMACGLGKTRADCEVAYIVAADDRVLIVAPTIDLVGQILRDWRDYRGDAHLGRVVAVCSDDGVLLDRDGQPLVHQQTMVTTGELNSVVSGTLRQVDRRSVCAVEEGRASCSVG